MSKRPSELNVVDRIFYDIQIHGIQSVLDNKEFYQNYEPSKLSQGAVSKSFYCWNKDCGIEECENICISCKKYKGNGLEQ